MESTQYLEPTIIVRRDDEDRESVAYVGAENALIVFRSEEEAEKFRGDTDMYPAAEGFETVAVDEVEIGHTCVRHGFDRVCLHGPWTGTSGVVFYDASAFVGMLRELVVEDD